MSELTFDVTPDASGRLVAEARENGIATDGESWEELRANVQDLIAAYYAGAEKPSIVHLHEILAVA